MANDISEIMLKFFVVKRILSPKTILPITLGLEVLAWLLIPRDSGKYSLTGVIDATLISPSILGVLLLWRYQYEAKKMLRIVAVGLLSISCAFYLVFIVFSFYVMVMPQTKVSISYVAVALLTPLIINMFFLYKIIFITAEINR
ncbi:MAG: hypothetical protein WKG07_04080 [Hymenobacter sp.]